MRAPARVLLVDDEDALRRVFARQLTRAGHVVYEAATGARAVELLAEHTFDAVISDIHMPDMDGMRLLRHIRERQPEVPVLLVTGAPELESAMQAVEYGAFEYLTKPIDLAKLETSVTRAIERYRATTERRQLADAARGPASGASFRPDVGTVLADRYRLIDVIGVGGMGTVYEAVREDLAGMHVAVKVLHPRFADRADIVERFRVEAQVVATIDHPNIVRIIDFAPPAAAGPAFIAMELLRGTTLSAAIQRSPPFSEGRVAFIASQILSALDATHAANVIHRDLKPDNVFLTTMSDIQDVVKILDFGIAKVLGPTDQKLTDTGIVLGTPAYIPPEHARGGKVDLRADLYAVGCIMYEALTGGPPFIAHNYNALLHAIQHDEPAPVQRGDVSREIVGIVVRALSKDPSDRFESAAAMRTALAPWLPSGPDGSVPPAPLGYAPTLELKRRT